MNSRLNMMPKGLYRWYFLIPT